MTTDERLKEQLRITQAQLQLTRQERDQLELRVGDWTGRPCARCKGSGERPDEIYGSRFCQACGGTGEEWAFWKKRALDAEAALAKLQPQPAPEETAK